MSTSTTIRVPAMVRDKLVEISREEGKSTGQVIQEMLREREKKAFFAQMAEDFRRLRADPENWESYQKEVALWDTTLLDGLEDEYEWDD